MNKLRNGVLLEMSPEEVAEHNARKQQAELEQPVILWKEEMESLDNAITPRMVEDVFDIATGAKTPEQCPELSAIMEERKTKRSQKP